MRKSLLPILAIILISSAQASAQQQCMRDSSILNVDTVFVSPLPYTATNPKYLLKVACINQPYNQSVTIKVPPTFVFQGITLAITSASLATTGAVTGLPTGLTYSCDPPNCVFNANTLGCVLIYGTPSNPAQAPDTLDLSIKAKVNTSFGPLDITFPGPIAPGNYYLILKTAAGCMSAAEEANNPFYSLKNTPNPFSGQTTFHVMSDKSGEFQFQVFNMLGKLVSSQNIQLLEGENQFTYDAASLANGAYYFILGNHTGKTSGKMIVAN
ncbi:MAG: T9SS type A sorting domain-containing protein [Bacteroidetes bacterium]|nr:T9SS type A sorting domain-containing protein [Bacteroidota bacterium]